MRRVLNTYTLFKSPKVDRDVSNWDMSRTDRSKVVAWSSPSVS